MPAEPRLRRFGHCSFRISRHRLDELDAAKAKRRPVLIDRHLANSFKANSPQRCPAGVPIEVTPEVLRAALWIGQPDYGISLGLRPNGFGEARDLLLLGDKRKQERDGRAVC